MFELAPGWLFNFLGREGDANSKRRLFEGGHLLQILSLTRGTNSKRGAYLKLGANSSLYGNSPGKHASGPP